MPFFTTIEPVYFVATICNPVYFMGCATSVRVIMSRSRIIYNWTWSTRYQCENVLTLFIVIVTAIRLDSHKTKDCQRTAGPKL